MHVLENMLYKLAFDLYPRNQQRPLQVTALGQNHLEHSASSQCLDFALQLFLEIKCDIKYSFVHFDDDSWHMLLASYSPMSQVSTL